MEISAYITSQIEAGDDSNIAKAVATEIAVGWLEQGWAEGDSVEIGGGDWEYLVTVHAAASAAGLLGTIDEFTREVVRNVYNAATAIGTAPVSLRGAEDGEVVALRCGHGDEPAEADALRVLEARCLVLNGADNGAPEWSGAGLDFWMVEAAK